MSKLTMFVLCAQVLLVQHALGHCLPAPPCYAAAPCGPAYAAPACAPVAARAGPGYGGAGTGELSAKGEIPVSGSTAVQGSLPATGQLQYGGAVPAAGVVYIVGNTPPICQYQPACACA